MCSIRMALIGALAGLLGLSVEKIASAGSVREPVALNRPQVSAPLASGASGRLGIKVVGNKFTDLNGNVLQLQGTSVAGLDISYSPSMWDGFDNTSVSIWRQIASAWQMNIIRLPQNEWAWRTNAKSARGIPYQTLVQAVVANITAAGMYVILDLHWAAPNVYNGYLSGNNARGYADGQPGYLDADNSINYWTSMANAFKNNPAVLFELFNEPYADDTGSAWDSTRLGLLLNGGSFTLWDQARGSNSPTNTGLTFNVAGHQQLVTAIRNTGATNVILYSCPSWDNRPSQSLIVKPNDPLNQLAATIHYSGGTQSDWTNILNAGVPILETEFYNPVISGNAGYAWLQQNKIGYVMWGANNWGSNSDMSSLITHSPWSFNSGNAAAWRPF
jgi:endoglucanase